ncbi:MAG: hypothetical protein ABSF41_06030 [Pseudolabrys sp.]|jgi:hypothetical protein
MIAGAPSICYVQSFLTRPKNSIGLSVEVRHQVLAFLEQRQTGGGARRDIAFFEAMSSLADALSRRGLLAEAADAASDAAAHAQKVFRSSDEKDLRRLSLALGDLSNRLGEVGRFQEALEKAEKTEDICRMLAGKQPDAYPLTCGVTWLHGAKTMTSYRLLRRFAH